MVVLGDKLFWRSVRSDEESGVAVGMYEGMLVASLGNGKAVLVDPRSVSKIVRNNQILTNNG